MDHVPFRAPPKELDGPSDATGCVPVLLRVPATGQAGELGNVANAISSILEVLPSTFTSGGARSFACPVLSAVAESECPFTLVYEATKNILPNYVAADSVAADSVDDLLLISQNTLYQWYEGRYMAHTVTRLGEDCPVTFWQFSPTTYSATANGNQGYFGNNPNSGFLSCANKLLHCAQTGWSDNLCQDSLFKYHCSANEELTYNQSRANRGTREDEHPVNMYKYDENFVDLFESYTTSGGNLENMFSDYIVTSSSSADVGKLEILTMLYDESEANTFCDTKFPGDLCPGNEIEYCVDTESGANPYKGINSMYYDRLNGKKIKKCVLGETFECDDIDVGAIVSTYETFDTDCCNKMHFCYENYEMGHPMCHGEEMKFLHNERH